MMMQDALPGIKAFLQIAELDGYVYGFVIRLVSAFVLHIGRMSASQAAGAVRTQARHRAAVTRFLAACRWGTNWQLLEQLAEMLVQAEQRRSGTWLMMVDQTFCGQQGQKTENTFSRANYRPRPKKGKRRQKKHAKRSCHCWVHGLLITPSGLRIPLARSYYTKEYCQAKDKPYRRQTEVAADLIRMVPVPAGADVVVLGDTAFDAACIREVCAERSFVWIVPVNPERVLAGKKPRPRVASLVKGLTASQFAPVRLTPGQGAFVAQRRVARCRLGPKVKTRTFYVHQERRDVHSVGRVRLLFSSKQKPTIGKPVEVQKILMTNDRRRSVAELVELYDLRWQIELFFKELKSTLGFHQYRFRRFAQAERWVELCLVTFLYLEWYRARQLRRRDQSAADRRWWHWQRTYGLCLAVRQAAEDHELRRLADWTQTPTGRKKLRRCLRAARPLEYRQAG